MSWSAWARSRRAELDAAGLLRTVRDLDARGVMARTAAGVEVVTFASNDYLGLSAHPSVVAAARAALERWGAGAGAARLVTGARPVHSALERALAEHKDTEDALLFTTGYMANLGVLSAFGRRGALICSDELNHASIIDGCRLARAEVAVYPHTDLVALERLLRAAPRAIVVSDTVFSMDGDVAPVDDLIALCARHGALLVLDEAHAVLGPEVRPAGEVLRVGTLSKTLGSLGGFVAGPSALVRHLVSTARPFIFTTATTPADAAAALAALEVLRSSEGHALLARLRANVDALRPGHPSPIVPVVFGDERAALRASKELLARGYLVPAIRPPSVPPGTARLRVTVSAAHTPEQIAGLKSALGEVAGVVTGG